MSPRQSSAAAVGRPAIPEDDPVWQAVLRAPVDDEPLTAAELEAMAEGTEGPWIPHEEVTAEIRKRAEAEGAGAELDAIFKEAGARLPRGPR
jgi:hypothetical protein